MDSTTWTRIKRWIVWAAWLGLALDMALWLLLADAPIGSPGLLLLLALLLVMGLWLCLGVLAIRYRRRVGAWYGLAGAILLLSLARWGGGASSSLGASLATLATMSAMVVLPLSMILFLWKQDVSIVLIGLATLAFVWGILLASRPYGDPLRAWLLAMTTPAAGQFWWFDALSCLLMTTLPLAGLAFLAHFLRLVVKEIQGP